MIPRYSRRTLIAAANITSRLGHSAFDNFVLEMGIEDVVQDRSVGLAARASSLAKHVVSHPDETTEDGIKLSEALVARAEELVQGKDENIAESDPETQEFFRCLKSDRASGSKSSGNVAAPTVEAEQAIQAVSEAIEALTSAGQRPFSHNVPRAAQKILLSMNQGRLSAADSSVLTKAAIAKMVSIGALSAPAEPWKDWQLLDNAAANVPLYPQSRDTRKMTDKSRIFLVHGQDAGAKHEVARFIEKLGFDVTILHEQANKGRTLITKFQESAHDIAFAVVLMTGDDTGRSKVGTAYNSRARQNVIFELGFFIGKIGSANVCALLEQGVERPSDFEGVAYVSYGVNTDWQRELAREFQAAGLRFDANRLL